MKPRLTIYLAAAAILAATTIQARAQEADPLDAATKAVATPAPTAAATPRPAAIQAPPAPRTATTTAAPRSTPAAPAAPRVSVKDELAHGHFVQAGDLAGMAGKKAPANTFLVGQWKATGSGSGGRKEFTDGGLFGSGKTKLLIRFPISPDPRVLVSGSSTKWEKPAPLRVESVSSTKDGITVYCTDVTP